jgi:arsenate reductase
MPEKKERIFMDKRRILFLCTNNSSRSQMAEAYLRFFFGDRYEAWSAGIESGPINPYAIDVMAEEGIDLSGHYTKNVWDLTANMFDSVVTVCDSVYLSCPFFPGAKNYMHKGFPDPSLFQGTERDKMMQFRKVRDETKIWIKQTFDSVDSWIWDVGV